MGNTLTCDLMVGADAWADVHEDWQGLSEAACGALAETVTATGEIALLLTDNAHIQALNAQFRGKDRPTDVLSFPCDPAHEPFLGDVAIAFEVTQSDAEEQGKSLRAHVMHLIIHGALHLLGYDHESETDAAEMEALERKALARLGLPDPYL